MRVARGDPQTLPTNKGDRSFRIVSPHDSGLIFRFPWRRAICDDLTQIPGIRYAPDVGGRGAWWCPNNAVSVLESIASAHAMPLDNPIQPPKPAAPIDHPTAMPHQAAEAAEWVARGFRLLPWSMGTGKTLAAILGLQKILKQRKKIPRAVVVCPAIARPVWADEIAKWWPRHPPVIPIDTQKGAAGDFPKKAILLISYHLLPHLSPETELSAIVADECHHLANWKSKRTQAMVALTETNNAAILLMSGTPIANEPDNLYTQLDILEPGAWGSWTKFCKRYCEAIPNVFSPSGYDYKGLNKENAAELQRRLATISTRITKADIAIKLPPLTTNVINLPKPPKVDWAAASQNFDAYSVALKDLKSREAALWARELMQSGGSYAVIFTHLIDTAVRIQHWLGREIPSLLITGSHLPDTRKRIDAIDAFKAKNPARGVVIATMHSVGEAVNNLTFADRALFAELYYRPLPVVQAIARIHRIGTRSEKINIGFLCVAGTIDGRIMQTLRPKIENMGALLKAGSSEAALTELLTDAGPTEKQIITNLRRVAAKGS